MRFLLIEDNQNLSSAVSERLSLDFSFNKKSSFIFLRSDIITDYFLRKIKQ